MNYKEKDMIVIVNYLQGKNLGYVKQITVETGAEKLRVYPILFELEQKGIIKVLERESFGAPKVVMLKAF